VLALFKLNTLLNTMLSNVLSLVIAVPVGTAALGCDVVR